MLNILPTQHAFTQTTEIPATISSPPNTREIVMERKSKWKETSLNQLQLKYILHILQNFSNIYGHVNIPKGLLRALEEDKRDGT